MVARRWRPEPARLAPARSARSEGMKQGLTRRRDAGIVLGVVLVILGLIFLAGQMLPGLDLGHYAWPLFILVPGVVVLGAGLAWRDASWLVIPGSIVTVTGLVLAVQNATGLWASWAYAWALIAPGAVGVGIALQGLVRGSRGEVREGLRVAGIGLVIFLVGLGFFEGVLQISGETLGSGSRLILPALLILAGLGLLVRNLNRGRAARPQPPETTSPRS
jgi:hypothetical protein